MNATGWSNSAQDSPNAYYGIRISKSDRDKFMSATSSVIRIEIDGTLVVKQLPASFWNRCTEIRHPSITKFMKQRGLIPWPTGMPPKFKLDPVGENTFRLNIANSRSMFCPACVTEVDPDAHFCPRCGHKLSPVAATQPPARIPLRGYPPMQPVRNDKELAAALRQIGPKLNECHICSGKVGLQKIDFGLAKYYARRRWAEMAATMGMSAVTLYLMGIGIVTLPTKQTRRSVIRLRLVRCLNCAAQPPQFDRHPWYGLLWNYGYIQLIPPEQMEPA